MNCDGLQGKVQAIQNLILKHRPTVCLLQETKSCNIDYFDVPGYNFIHRSPFDPTTESKNICHGISIIYEENLNFEIVSPLTRPPRMTAENFSRFVAINLVDYDCVVANCYLPAVRSTILTETNDERLDECLSFINETLDEYSNVILAGDFNYDVCRDHETVRKAIIESHLERFNKTDINLIESDDPPYTFISHQHNTRRYLDRVLSTLDPALLEEYEILYDQDVGSDHLPLLVSFDVDVPTTTTNSSSTQPIRLCWQKAQAKHIQAYKRSVSKCLKNCAKLPRDNDLMNFLTNTLEKCAEQHIPRVKHRKVNTVSPDLWLRTVKPAQEEFKKWSSIFSIISPNSCNYLLVNTKRRLAKTRFKWCVKKFRREFNIQKANSYQTQTVFQGLKGKRNKLTSPPKSIEGKSPSQQPELWLNHYKKTYDAETRPKDIQEELIGDEDIKFTIDEIQSIIKRLDPKKAYKRHYHWRHCPDVAQQLLLDCLNSWVKSLNTSGGQWDFLEAIIGPIPKSATKPLSQIKSYRPIAMASSECYILEKLCLKRAMPYLQTLDNQFGYKSNHSTTHAIQITKLLMLKDDVHVALLDASSAFDKISHKRILDELFRREMPLNIIRIIIGLTIYSHFRIKWFESTSQEVLYPRTGVKQGGCMSAYLFAACYDILITDLNKCDYGVYLGETFVNHLVYADDIILMAKTNAGLEKLYERVMKFTGMHGDISMNPSKSIILRVGLKSNKRVAQSFCNIPTETHAKYLGAYVCSHKYRSVEVSRLRSSLYGRFNAMLRHRDHIKYLSDKNKRTIISGLGCPYGIETIAEVPPKVRKPHRIMTQTLWPSTFGIKDANGITILSRTLYCLTGTQSLVERHRLLRNKFILSAQKSSNLLVRNLIGKLETISELNLIPPWLAAITL